jgi:predicted nucleotidyltransferase component of viral defense system
MTPSLISKEQLTLINRRKLKYALAEAEKDYFLAVVSKLINESELGSKLVFKGGTALHHCYLPQMRFSEDLDFTAPERNVTVEGVQKVLEAPDYLAIREKDVTQATIRIRKLQYSGVLDTPNSIKVDIDIVQNVVLPPQQLPYSNVWGLDVTVNVMDIREICAEKIRAMSERARYRDFYDFYLIATQLGVNLNEVLDLVRQKEARNRISPEGIREHWSQARKESHAEVGTVYYDRTVLDDDSAITHLVESLSFEAIPVNSMLPAD